MQKNKRNGPIDSVKPNSNFVINQICVNGPHVSDSSKGYGMTARSFSPSRHQMWLIVFPPGKLFSRGRSLFFPFLLKASGEEILKIM